MDRNLLKKVLVLVFVIPLCFGCGSSAKSEKVKNEDTAKISSPDVDSTWATKLGWPDDKKVIILHADDIGMCQEANQAAKQQLVEGVIQSAAVMIPCPNAKEFISWSTQNPNLDVGLHLTLTSEWKTYRWATVADSSEVPGLLDEQGKMWHEVPQVVQHASASEVEKEIRAQIEQSIAWGYRPDHIDTHMGTLYGDPSYVAVYIKVAQEYGIPANIIDIGNKSVLNEFKSKGYPLTDEVLAMVDNYKLPKLDYFSSAPNADNYDEKIVKFKQLIKDLRPGLTEIIFHPSVETENLKGITNSWQQRVWESKMFSDPDLLQFFEDEGIIFTNWKEIMRRFKAQK